jgi:DNA repair protein RadA/Sms
VHFGEVSLSGAIRPVAHAPARLKEAQKLGFGRAVVPEATRADRESGLSLAGVATLADAVARIAPRPRDDRSREARPSGEPARERSPPR